MPCAAFASITIGFDKMCMHAPGESLSKQTSLVCEGLTEECKEARCSCTRIWLLLKVLTAENHLGWVAGARVGSRDQLR